MIKPGIIITGFLLLLPVLNLRAQEFISNKSVTGITNACNRINRIYNPPPEGFRKKSDLKGRGKIIFISSGLL